MIFNHDLWNFYLFHQNFCYKSTFLLLHAFFFLLCSSGEEVQPSDAALLCTVPVRLRCHCTQPADPEPQRHSRGWIRHILLLLQHHCWALSQTSRGQWTVWFPWSPTGLVPYAGKCLWSLLFDPKQNIVIDIVVDQPLWCKIYFGNIRIYLHFISFIDPDGAVIPLHWRHNDHDGVSNHQPHGCLLNRLFRRRSKKASKLRVTGLCVGNSPGPVNSPHKGPVTRKMFPFDDVIMQVEDEDPFYPSLLKSWLLILVTQEARASSARVLP